MLIVHRLQFGFLSVSAHGWLRHRLGTISPNACTKNQTPGASVATVLLQNLVASDNVLSTSHQSLFSYAFAVVDAVLDGRRPLPAPLLPEDERLLMLEPCEQKKRTEMNEPPVSIALPYIAGTLYGTVPTRGQEVGPPWIRIPSFCNRGCSLLPFTSVPPSTKHHTPDDVLDTGPGAGNPILALPGE